MGHGVQATAGGGATAGSVAAVDEVVVADVTPAEQPAAASAATRTSRADREDERWAGMGRNGTSATRRRRGVDGGRPGDPARRHGAPVSTDSPYRLGWVVHRPYHAGPCR